MLASGDGWRVADVLCTCGRHDRPFAELHQQYSIAVVLAGTFQYRATHGRALLVPGALMLGNQGEWFECAHDHGDGDRCVAFWYRPDYFEALAAAAGLRTRRPEFKTPQLPPCSELSPSVARTAAGLAGSDVPWDEIAVELATRAIALSANVERPSWKSSSALERRVSQVTRAIDGSPEEPHTLTRLARDTGTSAFHFLRTFERLTGVTPHQYVRRSRLRHAATRLMTEAGKVLDIALDCGFGDVSNFNRAFRQEFGMSPTEFRDTGPASVAARAHVKRFRFSENA
jgi:AraC-like DNA-binding protein